MDLKNIGADEEMREKLLELGGKTQVPFLVDTVSGVMMYESADIITYLEKQVSGSSVNSVRIHKSVGTSKVCS